MVSIRVFTFASLRTGGDVIDPPQLSELPQPPLPIPSEAARDIETLSDRSLKSICQRLQELNVCDIGKFKDFQIDQIATSQAR